MTIGVFVIKFLPYSVRIRHNSFRKRYGKDADRKIDRAMQ